MSSSTHVPEAESLDPATALATIKTQRQAVLVRSDLILIAWGLAWVVGYTGLALGAVPSSWPPASPPLSS